ncbi:endosome-associated-trafficking regulator 1 [Colius striatus]|uniref:endosome-associated-trafficking regulator 1 n=1 Tax=Colius striatus TaxID=57412 RepID=UPI002B1D247D|nr:endosome-associated-trafficking regulator 1 [Colius striatus]
MSWVFVISGTTETESLGLEEVNGQDGKLNYPWHSAYPPPQCKSQDSSCDSQVKDWEKPIPFSLNPGHSYMGKHEGAKNMIYAKSLAKHAPGLEKEAWECQEPFYKDVEIPDSLFKEDTLQSITGKSLGLDAFASWANGNDPYLGYPEYSRGAEPPHVLHKEAIWDRQLQSLQMDYNTLKEENAVLKGVVKNMQSSLESQACTVQKLKASLVKKEREAQEIQSFVQQTQWNFQLMTQRALGAESKVEKLQQEIFTLQRELESRKAKNKNQKVGQMISLEAMKRNIDFTVQKLYKIVTGANQSIKQLSSGVESLLFAAEVLKSTGIISEVETEIEP